MTLTIRPAMPTDSIVNSLACQALPIPQSGRSRHQVNVLSGYRVDYLRRKCQLTHVFPPGLPESTLFYSG